MTLRQRIEQRITDLRVERAIAAAATPGPWTTKVEIDGVYAGQETVVAIESEYRVSPTRVVSVGQTRPHIRNGVANARHIATQDPATTIARVDRELAGCAADLALLGEMESHETHHDCETFTGPLIYASVRRNLATRYSKEESS
jgi:hypothetical protein